MLVTDSVALGDIRVADGGYLEAVARTARTGVQTYRGVEVGRPDFGTVNVYRDATEVFSRRSLNSFSKIPLTIDHPAEPVTAANWKQHAVGTTGDEVLRDGEHLKIGLKITDAAAVDAVRNGKRELSVGYSTELVFEDGTAPDGTPYQARQTAIVANHIAIVAAGRAGPQCRIGDSWADFTKSPEPHKEPTMSDTRTVVVDGLSVLATDQSAQAIDKLLKERDAARTAASDTEKAHKVVVAAKDKELGDNAAEIAKLKSEVLTPAQVDKLVSDRADVLGKAKIIAADAEVAGRSVSEIRRIVVAKKLGDDAVKDRSDDYIEALFDGLSGQKPTDPVRDVIRSGHQPHQANDAATVAGAHNGYVSHLTDAWKGEQQKGAA